MELEKVYQSIIDGKAMLITGSGAHTDVLTPDGCKFPSGIDLARTIYSACGITNPENPYDLQDAADTFLEKNSADKFIVELKKMLLVGQVQQEHRDLYNQPWQRVYTTFPSNAKPYVRVCSFEILPHNSASRLCPLLV